MSTLAIPLINPTPAEVAAAKRVAAFLDQSSPRFGRLYYLPADDGDTVRDRQRDLAITEALAEQQERVA